MNMDFWPSEDKSAAETTATAATNFLPSFQAAFSLMSDCGGGRGETGGGGESGDSGDGGEYCCGGDNTLSWRCHRYSEPDSDFEYDLHSDCSSDASTAALKLLFPLDHCLKKDEELDHPLYTPTSPASSSSSSSSSSYSGSFSEEDEGLGRRIAKPKPKQQQKVKSGGGGGRSKRIADKLHCPHCPKAFPSQSQLEEHSRYRHSDVRTHQCHLCPKVFKTKSNLNQHAQTHLGAKAECALCGRRLTLSGLRYHLLTAHEGSGGSGDKRKRFSCPLCPAGTEKTFAQNKLLQKHLASCHTAERKHGCPHCPARFKRKDHLVRHVTDTHSLVEKLFECEECGGRFQSARRLHQHQRQQLHHVRRNKEKTTSVSSSCSSISSSSSSSSYDLVLDENLMFLDVEELVDDTALSAFIEEILVSRGDGEDEGGDDLQLL